MSNKSFIVAIVLTVALLAAGSTFAESSASAIEAKIREVLTHRHPKDDASWWRGLGPKAPGVIIKLIDGTKDAYEKHRLLGALAWFSDDPEAVEFLRGQIEGTDDSLLRATAIKSLGLSQGAKEAEYISKYLSSSDQKTRVAAGKALREMKDPKAKALLDQYLYEEKVDWIVSSIKGELPKPVASLSPVASSDDRVNPAFSGKWSGFMISPHPKDGLKSEPAQLDLEIEEGIRLRGILTVTRSGKRSLMDLGALKTRGEGFSGRYPIEPQPVTTELEGRYHQSAGVETIEIRVPKLSSTLVLRKH